MRAAMLTRKGESVVAIFILFLSLPTGKRQASTVLSAKGKKIAKMLAFYHAMICAS